MVFTRPANLPMPTIWHRFTTKGMKLRVQDLTEDQVEPAVQLLTKYFMADEPPCKYIGNVTLNVYIFLTSWCAAYRNLT